MMKAHATFAEDPDVKRERTDDNTASSKTNNVEHPRTTTDLMGKQPPPCPPQGAGMRPIAGKRIHLGVGNSRCWREKKKGHRRANKISERCWQIFF